MKHIIPIILKSILLVCLFSTYQAKADLTGGEVYYKCTSTPGIYAVTLIVYIDCNGVPLCPSSCGAACTQTMRLMGADPSCSFSSYGNFTVNLVSVRDLNSNPDYPSLKNKCTNTGCVLPGTYQPSVERYEFVGYCNIGPTSGIPSSCCNVRFVWTISNQRGQIATIVNPGSAAFYIDAVVNRCLSTSPCNSSPVPANEPQNAICGGQNYVYNMAAKDPDLDSLTYAFAPALGDFNVPLTYVAPFSAQTPMPWSGNANAEFPGGIHCNPNTGDISFTPGNSSTQNFTGVLALEIKQWKTINGVPTVIGITRRDAQMTILANCAPNNPARIVTTPPDPINSNAPKTNWEICEGEQLCFTVTARDTDFIPPTISDTTYLTWDSALASLGATFLPTYNPSVRKVNGPREDQYQFCWTPQIGLGGSLPYYFTITTKDSRLPNPGKTIKSFAINVHKRATVSMLKQKQNCGYWKLGFVKNLGSQYITNSTWKIASEPGDSGLTRNPFVFTNTNSLPALPFTKKGKYLIQLSTTITASGFFCANPLNILYDTIEVVDDYTNTITRDTFTTCIGSPVKIAVKVTGFSPFEYRWYNHMNDTPSTPLNGTKIQDSTLTVTPEKARYYTIQVKDKNGCVYYDSINVKTSGAIKGVLYTPVNCFGDSSGSIKITMVDTNMVYQYKLNNGSFQFSNTFTNLKVDSYTITTKDSNNCLNAISDIVIKYRSKITAQSTVNNITCKGLTDGQIVSKAFDGFPPYYFKLDTGFFDTINTFKNLSEGAHRIIIKDILNCMLTTYDTIKSPLSIGSIKGDINVFQHSIVSYSIKRDPAISYVWNVERGVIMSQTDNSNSTIVVAWDTIGTGVVRVLGIKNSSCADTVSVSVNIGLSGIDEKMNPMGISIYPNPSKNFINISVQRLIENETIELFDLQGKLLLQQKLKATQQMNIEQFPQGVYMLKVGDWHGKIFKH